MDLASVCSAEWDAIAELGFDDVWLMGMWERSPAGISIANRKQGLLADFRRALADFRLEDNVGSLYCVRQYVMDPSFYTQNCLKIHLNDEHQTVAGYR